MNLTSNLKKYHADFMKGFKQNPSYYIAIILVIGYFIYRLFDLLLRLKFPVIPDERGHYNLIQLYHNRELLQIYLENTAEIIQSTTITRRPWLYHYLLGRALYLNIFGVSDFVILRVINIFLSICTIFTSLLIIKQITKSKFLHVIFLGIITNIPMYTFLSVGISYDNLINLFAALSILVVLLLEKRDTLVLWVSLFMISLMGVLTKNTFIPLVLIEISILMYLKRKMFRKTNLKDFVKYIAKNRYRFILPVLLISGLAILIIDLHGKNIFLYKSITPRCDEVISKEICENNALFNRGEKYRSLDLPEARMDFYHYLYHWKDVMSARTLGVYSHSSVPKTLPLLAVYELAIIVSALTLYKKYNKSNPQINIMTLVVVFYVSFLILYQNFPGYLRTNDFALAVQGRYIFPVIIPITGILLWGANRITPWRWVNNILLLVFLGFMVYGDYIYFNLEVTSQLVH